MPMRPPIGSYSCTIKGCVVDQNSNPQQGLNVEWSPFGNGDFKSIAMTDTEGRYETKIAPIPYDPSDQTFKVRDTLSILTVSPNITVMADFTI